MIEPKTLLIVPIAQQCNAACKFCVTKTLNKDSIVNTNQKPFRRDKLERVLGFCRNIGVHDVNITGGGEPLLTDRIILCQIIADAADIFKRVQLYTNAGSLTEELIDHLEVRGLTNITISRAHFDERKNADLMNVPYILPFEEIISKINIQNIDLKLSCLLYGDGGVCSPEEIVEYIHWAKEIGVRKVIFRELLGKSPYRVPVSIIKSVLVSNYDRVYTYEGLWGQEIYIVDGIAVGTYPDGHRPDTVNHGDLIYMPDNHLYSSWNHVASRIM